MSKRGHNNWNYKLLGELVKFHYGKSPSEIQNPNGKYPVWGTGGISDYGDSFLFNGESIVVGRKGSISEPIYVKGPFWVIDTAFFVSKLEECNLKWLYYNLSSQINLENYNEATGVPSLSKSTLEKIKVYCPPYFEQQKIAEILTTVDNTIEKTEQIIEKYKKVKEGMMQDLFTRGIDENGNLRPSYEQAPHLYKETELGMIPKEWDVQTIDETSEVNPESLPETTSKDTLIRYIDIESISNFSINSTKELNFGSASSRARRVVREGDIIISTVRPYLKAFAYIGRDFDGCICSTGFAVIKTKELIDEIFMFQYVLTDFLLMQLLPKMVGSNYPAVNNIDIKNIVVPIPSLSEQKKIVKILNQTDKRIINERSNLYKLQKLKQGLMQDLLTGKVRVKV